MTEVTRGYKMYIRVAPVQFFEDGGHFVAGDTLEYAVLLDGPKIETEEGFLEQMAKSAARALWLGTKQP